MPATSMLMLREERLAVRPIYGQKLCARAAKAYVNTINQAQSTTYAVPKQLLPSVRPPGLTRPAATRRPTGGHSAWNPRACTTKAVQLRVTSRLTVPTVDSKGARGDP